MLPFYHSYYCYYNYYDLYYYYQRYSHYYNYCYFKNNKQARAPSLMGPFSKENNTCQPDLGEVEGQRSMQITPERFLIRCHVSLALFHYHSGPERPILSPSAATPRPILATMKTTSPYLTDSNFL